MKDDDYRDYDECEEGRAVGFALCMSLTLLIVIVIGIALMLSACTTTKYVPVETVRTEYKDKMHEVITTDTVTDTRFVYVKGDTVVDWRDRVRWRDRVVHDSVYITLTDSVPVPYPVERELSAWERAKQDYGGWAMAVCVAAVVALAAWMARRFRRM